MILNVILRPSFFLFAGAALGNCSASIPKRHCDCPQKAPESKCENIKPNIVRRIEQMPAGPFCNTEEVSIHFKKGRSQCVDPTAKSVINLEKIIQLRAATTFNISTTSTPETTTTDN